MHSHPIRFVVVAVSLLLTVAVPAQTPGARTLQASASTSNITFTDGFDYYAHLANDSDMTLDTFDPAWASLGVAAPSASGDGALTQVSDRVTHDESFALGGNYVDVTGLNPLNRSGISSDVEPVVPAARVSFRCGAGNQMAGSTTCPVGHKSIYQHSSAAWLGHPESFSFAADMEHSTDYTTTVLLTPDDTVATQGLSSYLQEPDFIALRTAGDGTLHVIQRIANGPLTDLTPQGLSYGFLANQMMDYRLTTSTGSNGLTTLSVEEYLSKDEDMSLSTVPSLGEPGATTGLPYDMTAPGQWYRLWSGATEATFTHAHLWFDLEWNGGQSHLPEGLNYNYGAPWSTLDQVAEVDPTSPTSVATPAIQSYVSQDSSVVVTFTSTAILSQDPNVVGYALIWSDPSTGQILDRKDTTWAGESSIQANGILPSDGPRNFRVFPILVGGALGPGSNTVSASAASETTGNASYARMNGFFDSFNGGTEATTGVLDPNNWDIQSRYISHDSASFVMNDHWMQTASCGDSNNGFDPHCVEMFRIRKPFDFRNRTGVLRWEVDSSSYDRNWYDVTLSPEMLNPRTVSFFYNSGTQTSADLFKIMHAVGSQLDQFFFESMNGDRVEHFQGCETGVAPCFPSGVHQVGGADVQYKVSPNFRAHIALAINRSHFALYINCLNADLSGCTPYFQNNISPALNFDKAYVTFAAVPYHTDIYPETGSPDHLEYHWDNIGFDAPVGNVVPTTLAYYPVGCQPSSHPALQDGCLRGDERGGVGSTYSVTVSLPANFSSANAQALASADFVLQGENIAIDGQSQMSLTVNGQQAMSLYPNSNNGQYDLMPLTATVPLNELHAGVNTFTIVKTRAPAGISENYWLENPQLELSYGQPQLDPNQVKSTVGQISTPTNTPVPGSTSTSLPTNTSTPVATSLDTSLPTSTSTPVATNTPMPTGTNTPVATSTGTPVPTGTYTSVPATVVPTATTGANPAVTINSTSAGPSNLLPGESVALGVTLTSNSVLSSPMIDFEVYDATGAKVYQTAMSPSTVSASSAQTFRTNWTLPTTLTPGSYRLKVGVFSNTWSTLYAWDDGTTAFMVSANQITTPTAPPSASATTAAANTLTSTAVPATATSTPTSSSIPATAIPTSISSAIPSTDTPTPTSTPSELAVTFTTNLSRTWVAPGGSEIFSTMILPDRSLTNSSVVFGIYSPSGRRVWQKVRSGVNFTGGVPLTFTTTWATSSFQTLGTYTLRITLQSASGAALASNNKAATVLVANSAPIGAQILTSMAPIGSRPVVAIHSLKNKHICRPCLIRHNTTHATTKAQVRGRLHR